METFPESFETPASDVRRVGSQADWVRADALTHRKQLVGEHEQTSNGSESMVRGYARKGPSWEPR